MSAPGVLTTVFVASWYDGDTFKGDTCLGGDFYIGSTREPVRHRIAVIDAPELATPRGPASRDFAATLLPAGHEYRAWFFGLDNYGRPLVDPVIPGAGLQLSEAMLRAGMADPYGKKKTS